MKQTAVEFLVDNLNYYYSPKWNDMLDQAKEMEKQQIIDAYWEGSSNWDNETEAEQYYNEQFKNK
jgi:hypothetical protein